MTVGSGESRLKSPSLLGALALSCALLGLLAWIEYGVFAMAADEFDEGRDRVVSLTRPRWRVVSLGISQFGLAMFFFGCGAILLKEMRPTITQASHSNGNGFQRRSAFVALENY